MKKVAIGCAVVLLLVLVVGGIGAWWAVNKVKSTVTEFAELGTIPEIERTVVNTASYDAPESGELTGAQVERYLRVQQQVRDHLGTRFAELNRKYESLIERQRRNDDSVLDVPQVIAAYRDLASTYVDAKRAQADALNGEAFSLTEYRWVRRQVYGALGLPVFDLDVGGFIDDVKSGRSPRERQLEYGAAPAAPPANRTLVEPHRTVLEENAALTFFGL